MFSFVFPEAINASQRSQKECRVYVGNLAYEVKWGQLKDFMRRGLLYIYIIFFLYFLDCYLYKHLLFNFFKNSW
jgi:hypothetical protein